MAFSIDVNTKSAASNSGATNVDLTGAGAITFPGSGADIAQKTMPWVAASILGISLFYLAAHKRKRKG